MYMTFDLYMMITMRIFLLEITKKTIKYSTERWIDKRGQRKKRVLSIE